MELKICNQKFDMKREIHTDIHFTPDNIILSFRFENEKASIFRHFLK